jgi:hypothetical protein
MPNSDFIYSAIVILGIGLIIFICSRIYNKFKEGEKRKRAKAMVLETLKEGLLFEIKGKAKISIEKNTKNSDLIIHVITINKCTETVIINNIEVIINDFVGKLVKEKAIKTMYHSRNTKSLTIGEKITFPFALTPNTPNNMSLTFLFDTTSVFVRKINIKLYTSHGELVYPITVEIER